MTSPQPPDEQRRLIDWIVAGLGVVLAVLLFFLVRQSEVLRRESMANAHLARIAAALRDPAAVASGTAMIQSWMTFDYINRVFALPPDYLKTDLSVADARYPRLTVGEFAEDDRASASSTLINVQNAVRDYLLGTVPAAASSF